MSAYFPALLTGLFSGVSEWLQTDTRTLPSVSVMNAINSYAFHNIPALFDKK
jgi:hypothetical protein